MAGQEGLFWIVPLCGGLLVLATYGLGVQLASPPAGLAAAALVATSPILLYMIVAPMSDVPAAGAWAAAFWAMGRPGPRRAILAGVAAALAITIRPNLAFGAGLLAAGYGLRWWFASAADRGGHRRDVVAYAASLLPGVVAVALVHMVFYGSPLRSGYGPADDLFFVDPFWPTLWTYVGWLIETQTPLLLVGAATLWMPVGRLWPSATDRAAVLLPGAFTLAVWIMYGAYYQFDAWWYLRFLLPAWPFMAVGLAALLVAAASRWRATRVGALLLVIGLGAFGVREATTRGVFDLWRHERRYPSVARLVRERTDGRSVLIALQHSGSLRYYAGRLTLRADVLEPDWLDRAVAWFTARGIRPYFLLDEGEVPWVRARFAGQRTLNRLDVPPLVVYRGTTAVWLVDLALGDGGDRPGPVEVRESYEGERSLPPVAFVPPCSDSGDRLTAPPALASKRAWASPRRSGSSAGGPASPRSPFSSSPRHGRQRRRLRRRPRRLLAPLPFVEPGRLVAVWPGEFVTIDDVEFGRANADADGSGGIHWLDDGSSPRAAIRSRSPVPGVGRSLHPARDACRGRPGAHRRRRVERPASRGRAGAPALAAALRGRP